MTNENGNGWKNWILTILLGVLVSVILFGTAQIQGKADKEELKALETRCEKRDDQLRADLKESIDRFEKRQNEIYNLLIGKK
jgi:hypothetical protein